MTFVHELEKHSHASQTHRSDSSVSVRHDLSTLPDLQRNAGNQAMQQLLRSRFVQAKLAISSPDDPEEREADQVASTIMRKAVGAPASSPCSCSGGGEMCEECQQKQSLPTIQRRVAAPSAPSHLSRIVSEVLRSPGHPLDSITRAFFEPRFGHDFSHVRIHTEPKAAASAEAIHAQAYTFGNELAFAGNQFSPATTGGKKLLAHELTHVVQQGSGASAIQRTPDTQSPQAQPAPAKPKPRSLRIQIRIGDVIQFVKDRNIGRYDDFTKTLPKELLKRFKDQVKERLSFLVDQGFQVSVEFGAFQKSDLKVPGNIQVWLVDELDDEDTPGQIMKKLYGYKDAAAKAANENFKNVISPGPGEEFKEVGGLTINQIDDSVPGTSEPVFIKVSSIFYRDEISDYKKGKKEEAELGIDEISATTSHELGHVLRSEPEASPNLGHAIGNFNDAKQTFPPDLMDKVGARGGWTTNEGTASPRLSTEPNDRLSKEAIDTLGGWDRVFNKLILPNFGDGKMIRRVRGAKDGAVDLWYNFKNIGYTDDEKNSMIEFLKGIEMSQANNKWKKN